MTYVRNSHESLQKCGNEILRKISQVFIFCKVPYLKKKKLSKSEGDKCGIEGET